MNARLGPFAACVVMCAALAAQASQTVTPGLTVVNKCDQDRDRRALQGVDRLDDGALRQCARGTKERVASSDNAIFYYYAQSLSGKHKWGRDVNHKVDGQVYGMKKRQMTLDTQRNRYVLSLSCNGS